MISLGREACFLMLIYFQDTLLLAEIHLSFRKLLRDEYELSCDWMPTLPSFCYQAFLR